MEIVVPSRVMCVGGSGYRVDAGHPQAYIGAGYTMPWVPLASHKVQVDSGFFSESAYNEDVNNVFHVKPVSEAGSRVSTCDGYFTGQWSDPSYCFDSIVLNGPINQYNTMYYHVGNCCVVIQASTSYVYRRRQYLPWCTIKVFDFERYYNERETKGYYRTSSIEYRWDDSSENFQPYSAQGAGGMLQDKSSAVRSVLWSTQNNWSRSSWMTRDVFPGLARRIASALHPESISYWNIISGTRSRETVVYEFSNTRMPNYSVLNSGNTFLFAEPLREEGIIINSTYNYWYHVMKQEAFIEAASGFPRLNDNSISNVLEIAGFIYSLVVLRKVEVPKRLSEMWLAYRYQYTTTKADVKEAIHFVSRHANLDVNLPLTQYGISTRNVGPAVVTCRCEIKATHRELKGLKKLWDALCTYGLTPDFYVIWDMMPYSFIVDWFIPIGNMATALDAKREYSEEHYDYQFIGYSFSYDLEVEGVLAHHYSRWYEGSPPALSGFYSLEPTSPSERTIGYRVLDTISITLGGR